MALILPSIIPVVVIEVLQQNILTLPYLLQCKSLHTSYGLIPWIWHIWKYTLKFFAFYLVSEQLIGENGSMKIPSILT